MDAAYDHPDIAIIPSVANSPRGRRAWLGGAIGPLQSAAGALAATPVSRRPHADGARRPLEPCYPNNPWTQQQVTRGVCRDPGTPKYGDVVAETAWCATPPPRRSPAVNSAAGHGVADTPVGAFDASASRSDLSPRTATATPLAGRRNDPYDRCSQQAEEAPHYNLDSIRLAAPRHFLLPRYSFSPRASLPTLADLSPVEAPPTAVPAKAPTERVCADGEGENTVPASLIVTVNFLRRQDAYIADSNSMANIRLGDHVIVDGDAGLDCGKVLAVKLPRAGRCESSVPSKRVHRRATPREIREFQQGCQAAAAALPRIRAIVSRAEGAVENSARVEACEFQFDRAKLFVYYTAEPGFKFSYALTPLFQAFGCRIWMSRIVPERFQRQQETSDNGSKK